MKQSKVLVWCSKIKCTHNKEFECHRDRIHLKYQEDDKYNIHGEFVCKDYKEKEESDHDICECPRCHQDYSACICSYIDGEE